jgi:hypothetical protein
MTTILNNDFAAGETAQVTGTNTKFTDVQTATGQLNNDNARSESIDLWQMDATSSMVVASASQNTEAPGYTKTYTTGAHSSSPLVLQKNGNVDMILDMGSLQTLNPHDILRVYWNIEVTAQVLSTSSVYSGSNYEAAGGLFWGVWLQWSTNGSAWSDVPNQGSFSATTIGGTSYNTLAVSNTTTKAFTPIPHVAMYEDIGSNDIVYRYPHNANELYTTGSAWFLRPTPSSHSYRYFRLVLAGILTGMNTGGAPPVSHIADVGTAFLDAQGTNASITLRRCYMAAMQLRGA